MARRSWVYLRDEEGRLWSSVVRNGDKITDLPMHGSSKELGTGLVKKQLGLK